MNMPFVLITNFPAKAESKWISPRNAPSLEMAAIKNILRRCRRKIKH